MQIKCHLIVYYKGKNFKSSFQLRINLSVFLVIEYFILRSKQRHFKKNFSNLFILLNKRICTLLKIYKKNNVKINVLYIKLRFIKPDGVIFTI